MSRSASDVCPFVSRLFPLISPAELKNLAEPGPRGECQTLDVTCCRRAWWTESLRRVVRAPNGAADPLTPTFHGIPRFGLAAGDPGMRRTSTGSLALRNASLPSSPNAPYPQQ